MYHPTPTSTTDCTVGALYSDSSEAGIFTHTNQEEEVEIAASHGECIEACGYNYITVPSDSYGYLSCYRFVTCDQRDVYSHYALTPLRLCNGTDLIGQRQYLAPCTDTVDETPYEYCPLGWGTAYNYAHYLGGCYQSRHFVNAHPAYSGPSPEIGSTALSSMEFLCGD